MSLCIYFPFPYTYFLLLKEIKDELRVFLKTVKTLLVSLFEKRLSVTIFLNEMSLIMWYI